jgi:hypothetical protein
METSNRSIADICTTVESSDSSAETVAAISPKTPHFCRIHAFQHIERRAPALNRQFPALKRQGRIRFDAVADGG